jgi:CheY-like chemotaxis protein
MVDDDEMVVYLQQAFLVKSGISLDPLIAYSGGEALEYIKSISEDNPHILLFLDINMPDMSGWEVLDEINERSLAERIYVVIITSSVNKSDKEKAGTYKNIIAYFEKPININDFKKIRSLDAISGYFI